MNKFNLLLISLFIIQICSTTRSPTYNNRYPTPYPTRRPTPYPTPRPTQAFNNIYASYNLSKLDEEDYQTNLQSVTFKEAMTDRISDAITTVIQPSPTPTSWYYPDIEELYFSEADKTLDMYINIEVYWAATDEIKETQTSLIFENTMEDIFQNYFNTSELQFSVDRASVYVDDSSAMSLQWITSMFIIGIFGIALV